MWIPEPAERDSGYRAVNEETFRHLGLASMLDTSPHHHIRVMCLTAFSGAYAFGLYSNNDRAASLEVAWTSHSGPWEIQRAFFQGRPITTPDETGGAGPWEELADLIEISHEEGEELIQAANGLVTWPPVEGGYDGYDVEFERRGSDGVEAFHAWCPQEESHPALLPFLRSLARLAATRTTEANLARRIATLHDWWFHGEPALVPPPVHPDSVSGARRKRRTR